jgi:hypothetical protein
MRQHNEATGRCVKAISTIVVTTLLWALPATTWAVMKALSTEDLARGSDVVVLGDVESAAARWSDDGTTIVTTAVVVVTEVIKGRSVRRKIEVVYPGGEVGAIGLRASDEPDMERGEKVLLFLKQGIRPNETDRYSLVGKAQGKYSIGPDGVARKKGFSLAGDAKQTDAEVPLDVLVEKIRRAR